MAIYYCSPSGNNGNAGGILSPFQTIAKLMSVVIPGDMGFVRAGSYPENINTGTGSVMNSGSSWADAPIISAYPGESPVVQPPLQVDHGWKFAAENHYYEFTNLIFDGTSLGAPAPDHTTLIFFNPASASAAPNHIRFRGCEFRNINGNFAAFVFIGTTAGFKSCDANEFINCIAHDNIDPSDGELNHAYYLGSSSNLIEGGEIYNIPGEGIQIYNSAAVSPKDCSFNVIRKVTLHSCGLGSTNPSSAIIIGKGTGNQVYNNKIYNCAAMMMARFAADATLIYNNTFYGGGSAIANQPIQIGFGSGSATNTVVKDNIINGTPTGLTSIRNYGTGTDIEYNLVDKTIDNAGTGSGTIANNLLNVTDPKFVNAAAHDFHLLVTSQARNAGTSTAPTVTDDFDGLPRPQETLYCIGAFEFAGSVPPPRPIIYPQVQVIGLGDEEEYD